MPDDVYRQLAKRLDEIPNGFTPTESGVELRLLAKIFEPDEAKLACIMTLTPKPAEEIAAKVNLDKDHVDSTLKAMHKKGLIRAQATADGHVFGLMPFIVGIFEQQLARMDEELATLIEDYIQETEGGLGMIAQEPALHRVVPVDEAIPLEVEIFPYERASELIQNAKAWGLRDCICRIQTKLVGKGCDHPVDNCIMFAPVEGAFDHSDETRPISKEEALEKLLEAEEMGLVHSSANQQGPLFYICNCCTCCCTIMRGLSEFGHRSSIARSGFRAAVEEDTCVGCGACLDACQFGAIAVDDDVCFVDPEVCVGCGLCISSCPEGALRLERRPEDEQAAPPVDNKDWMTRRAQERGMSLSDTV